MVKQYHLSDECSLLCTCAESTLTDVCDKISDGSVTPSELSQIVKRKNHVLKLIDAGIKNKDVVNQLEIRLREHKRFCEEKEHLVQLCDRVTIKIKGYISYICLRHFNYMIYRKMGVNACD